MSAWLSGRLEQRRGPRVGAARASTRPQRRPADFQDLDSKPFGTFARALAGKSWGSQAPTPRDGLGTLCSRVISGRAVMLKFTLRSGSVTPV